MSPTGGGGTSTEDERTELLGSLTTQQQQRTSARVIKKLKLEPVPEKTVGKGIDDIPECETTSKDVKDCKFPTVKQRMPKALWSIDEKNLFFEALNEYGKDFDAVTAHVCAKMKKKGMPDANLKTKTQVSHFYYRTWHKLSKHVHFDENVKKVAQELYALINYGELRKKLVSVNEKTCARLSEMVLGGSMVVRARGRNVRVRTPMCRALRKLNQISVRCGSRVGSCLHIRLSARNSCSWARVQASAHNPRAALRLPPRTSLCVLLKALSRRWGGSSMKLKSQESEDGQTSEDPDVVRPDEEEREDLEDLHLETDRVITQESKLPKRPVLHVGPPPYLQIHIPVVSPCEQLSSQKICFSSYLERIGTLGADVGAKIRTPKRQRKDSATDKDLEQKKVKIDDTDAIKLINIEETAIDGIELMANYKSSLDDEELQIVSTEDEILKSEENEDYIELLEKGELERDKDMSEKEKDSFSELEDDEKYNKSESDNESDHKDKAKDTKFNKLKVKFRIRPKKRGGSIYSLVVDKDQTDEFKEEEVKPDVDVEMVTKQIRKGWSEYDAGNLTVGDLYLMFGSRSKLELDYWWASPSRPLSPAAPSPRPAPPAPAPTPATTTLPAPADKTPLTPDKDSSVEDNDKASDTDIFSPKNYNQDSNDGLSGDERKGEQLASPDHKSSNNCSGTLKVVHKLINRVTPAQEDNGFALMSDRLKRLLALVGNPNIPTTANGAVSRCNCGHICPQQRKSGKSPMMQCPQITPKEDNSHIFRHPNPVVQAQDTDSQKSFSLEGLPKWRKRRSRADRRVVVQRLLPLLPKLSPPATNNLIPVRIVPNSAPAALPRIMPKPPPTSTSDLSLFYVLSESNGQFFFHDGDRRIPITPLPENPNGGQECAEDEESEEEEMKELRPEESSEQQAKEDSSEKRNAGLATPDLANFLPSESLSLSPSRLLRDHDGWFEGQDFSLSSFLGHLEGRPTSQPDLAVDSQLQSLMTESSVDFVAKFSDFAEVVDEETPLPPSDNLT